AEQTEIGLVELADGTAGDQVDESPPLQLPETVRGPQTTNSDAKRRDIGGFVGRAPHPEPQTARFGRLFRKLWSRRAVYARFAAKDRLNYRLRSVGDRTS